MLPSVVALATQWQRQILGFIPYTCLLGFADNSVRRWWRDLKCGAPWSVGIAISHEWPSFRDDCMGWGLAENPRDWRGLTFFGCLPSFNPQAQRMTLAKVPDAKYQMCRSRTFASFLCGSA